MTSGDRLGRIYRRRLRWLQLFAVRGLYRGFEWKLSPTMQQMHVAGERLFVDYAGDGVPVAIDRLSLLEGGNDHNHG